MLSTGDFQKTQAIVTDLTDKSTAICMYAFGQAAVNSYAGGDLTSLNSLINDLDDQVANLELPPEKHGMLLLEKLRDNIQG